MPPLSSKDFVEIIKLFFHAIPVLAKRDLKAIESKCLKKVFMIVSLFPQLYTFVKVNLI